MASAHRITGALWPVVLGRRKIKGVYFAGLVVWDAMRKFGF